eukprot:82798_1
MTTFRHSLENLLDKHEYTTGFAVIEESGLRIGSNGTLKNVNIMILNDICASARNIIDFTNELFNETPIQEPVYNNDNNETEINTNVNVNDNNNTDDIANEGMNGNIIDTNQQIEQIMDEQNNALDDDIDDDDDDDDEEEEEFKIVIETKNKQRLVLCTVEGVSCAMLQVPPYYKQNDNDKNEEIVEEKKTED